MPSAEFHSRTTTVRGLPTHDLHAAGPGGLPIVLVHGLAVSHRYLMPTARALATRTRFWFPTCQDSERPENRVLRTT